MVAVLRSLIGRCVSFRMCNGDQIVGIVRAANATVVRLSVSGRNVWLATPNISSFRRTTSTAC